jgi:CDP-diacylglycerol--serine O-phosphatidyltransferase
VTTNDPADAEDQRRRASLPPRFSLVRSFTPADFVTLLNALSGVSAIFATLEYAMSRQPGYLWAAVALVVLAAIADFLDGRVARKSARSSPLGGDLDSLADLISFGAAPACLAFAAGMNGGWDWAVLAYFVCCGLSRLARYNVTASALSDESGKVLYFEGTPIPTSLVLVLVMAGLIATGRLHDRLPLGAVSLGPATLHPLVLLYFVSGSAMISARLRVPKP